MLGDSMTQRSDSVLTDPCTGTRASPSQLSMNPLTLSGRLRYSGGDRRDIHRIALRRKWKFNRHELYVGCW